MQRIATFRQALIAVDTVGADEKQIEFTEASDNKVVLDNLEIATPTGCSKLNEPHVEIAQGERVLVEGESGAGKTILFRTIAGLWRWGAGRVTRPAGHEVMFMPRQPYVPLGTLRAALAYPSGKVSHGDEELASALRSTGLDRLASSIDKVERWDKELSFDEQQRLVFTRMLLHRPHCVVIDEALDALDDSSRECIIGLLGTDLKNTAIINIGRSATNDHFFSRNLQLMKEPSGNCFMPDLRAYGFGRTAEALAKSSG